MENIVDDITEWEKSYYHRVIFLTFRMNLMIRKRKIIFYWLWRKVSMGLMESR